MVAVGPDPAGLDGPAEAVAAVGIATPDAGSQAIERVVGDRERFVIGLEGRDRDDGTKDLLLEDSHLVVALEHRRLDVEAAGKIAAELGTTAAGQHLGALLLADVDIGEDLGELLARCLRADHGVGRSGSPCLIAATRFSARSMKRS